MEYKSGLREKDTDGRDIADLCLMCGQCCLAVATDFTHDELIEMSKSKEKEAQVFTDFFKKYESLDATRKVAPKHVAQVLKNKGFPEDYNGDDVCFYYCDKISADYKCLDYEKRPLCCAMAPSDGWSVMPPGCGYVGWQYLQRERIMQNIRSLKEQIYEIETLEGPDAFVSELNMSLAEFKEDFNEKIEPFKKYGAKSW